MFKDESHKYQYLFLGGILGEILSLNFVGNYLKENKKILRAAGLNNAETMTLNSLKSAAQNAKTLTNVILNKSSLDKKIIIFAHSKACLEVILCLKDNLPLFQKNVHKIICVQPPFQGSSLFEELSFLSPLGSVWPGLKSLKKNFYSEILFKEFTSNVEIQDYIKNNLLVVKGYKEKNVSWIIKPSHRFLRQKGRASDGLVILEDQVIPFSNYKEIIMEIDHSDLFTSTLLSNQSTKFRERIMKDLINWAVTPQDELATDPRLIDVPQATFQDNHEFEDQLKAAH